VDGPALRVEIASDLVLDRARRHEGFLPFLGDAIRFDRVGHRFVLAGRPVR
jgi:hypothetical protein